MTNKTPDLQGQRWVIKIGSALITNNGNSLARESLPLWVDQIAQLLKWGAEVVLVSSGSIAEGVYRLGLNERPTNVHELQASAAIGQAGLIQSYESLFAKHQTKIAQILLVHEDLSSRTRYLNARKTIHTLLEFGVVPIVNENDTVATAEIRFGDNDTLAGLVANLIDADRLIILTDQHGVFTDDPRQNSDAQLITHCDVHDSQLEEAARGTGSAMGRGGMSTKIRAAKLAARSGTICYIANGREEDVLVRLARGESLGTHLSNARKPITSRKQWLANLTPKGEVKLDEGAANALHENGVSLLPVGVVEVSGQFRRGDLIRCVDKDGHEIARGLSNYNCDETQQVAGKSSDLIADILGYGGDAELIHRDNLVIL